MAIKFEHGGKSFEADTPEQVVKLLDLLDRREVAASRREAYSVALTRVFVRSAEISAAVGYQSSWTPEVFAQFTERLGAPQRTALGTMVAFRLGAPDEVLRASSGSANNQALAGILSGISKQAQALGIPPRTVFTFENIRSKRGRSSLYRATDEFREFAIAAGWPEVKNQK